MGAELHLRPATTYAHRGCLTSFNPDPHTTTTTTSMASDRAGPSPVPQPAAPEPPETSYRQNHVRRSLVRPGGCVKRIPPTWPRPSPPHLTPESQATHDENRARRHPWTRAPPERIRGRFQLAARRLWYKSPKCMASPAPTAHLRHPNSFAEQEVSEARPSACTHRHRPGGQK